MYIIQRPDERRNLNISPFRIYVLSHQGSENECERLQTMLDKLNGEFRYIKCELVKFSKEDRTSVLAGDEIDVHLYACLTNFQAFARIFPDSKTNFMFLPDSTDALPWTGGYIEKLEKTLRGMNGALEWEMFKRLRIIFNQRGKDLAKEEDVKSYMETWSEDEIMAFFGEMESDLGFSSPKDSMGNLEKFLRYTLKNKEGKRIFAVPGEAGAKDFLPDFKVHVSKPKRTENAAAAVDGVIDITLESETEDNINIKFPTKDAKMTYLLLLCMRKFCPKVFFEPDILIMEKGKAVIEKVWNLLYTIYIDETWKNYISNVKEETKKGNISVDVNIFNQINNLSLKKKKLNNIKGVRADLLSVSSLKMNDIVYRFINLDPEYIQIDFVDSAECLGLFKDLEKILMKRQQEVHKALP